MWRSVFPEEGEPAPEVEERLPARGFKDEDCAVGVSEVGGDEALVLFLASSVPELEAVGAVCVVEMLLAKRTFLLRKSIPTVGCVGRGVPGSGGRSHR